MARLFLIPRTGDSYWWAGHCRYAEFKQAFHNGESIIIAELVELRYRHRYKVQLHAAVHGSKLFDPGKLLRKLSQRLCGALPPYRPHKQQL